MSKIFRKTRQDILSKGKTKTYLKYAIGEIALVVIGILIALQINNWNTRDKQSHTELKILEAMKENLNSDIIDMEENIKIYSRARKSTGEILQVLNFPGYETDSLNLYLGHLGDYATFIETTSAYENLKTIGFEIIKSDSLKKKKGENQQIENDVNPYISNQCKSYNLLQKQSIKSLSCQYCVYLRRCK